MCFAVKLLRLGQEAGFQLSYVLEGQQVSRSRHNEHFHKMRDLRIAPRLAQEQVTPFRGPERPHCHSPGM